MVDKKKSTYRFQVPKNSLTVIEDFVKRNYPKSFQRNLVRHLFIVDYISRGTYYFREDVPLNMHYLIEVLQANGKNVTRIVDNLRSLGIIEKSSNYVVGVTAKRYKLKDKSERVYSIPYNLFDQKCTTTIIEKRNKNQNTKVMFEDTEEAQLLLNYISMIDIDEVLLTSVINYPVFPFLFYTPHVGQFDEEDILELKEEYGNLLRIHYGDLYIKRPIEGSRVYTPFTNMRRDQRKHLSISGKTLKCVDIANSQPTLSAAFIIDYCTKHGIALPKEINYYKHICEQGLFYEEFMQGEERLPENRTDFKKNFFGSVFYTKPSKRKNTLRTRFIKTFPEIHNILDIIKKDLGNDGFANEMQKLEASIIFDDVNVSLLKDGYGCYNIYDSIVSHSDEVLEEAKIRIMKSFSKYSLTPTLKIEDFTKYEN